MTIQIQEVKQVNELDDAVALSDGDYFVVYQPNETAPKLRKILKSTLSTEFSVDLSAYALTTDLANYVTTTALTAVETSLQTQIDALSGGGGGVTINNPDTYIQAFEDGTNASGTGTTKILNTLTGPNTSTTYTNESAATAFPLASAMYGGIDVTTMTYDDVVIAEAIQTVLGSGKGTMLKSASGKCYRYRKGEWVIPNVQTGSGTHSRFKIIDFQGSLIEYVGVASNHKTFKKTCANLTELQAAIDYRLIMRNINLIGASRNDGSTGFDITGGRSCLFEDIEVKDFGTGFTGCTLLQSEWNRFNTAQCLIGFDAQTNKVTGASAADQVWQPILNNCRFRMIDATAIGCNFRGVEFPKIIDCGWEGSDALYAVKYDNAGNAVAKKMLIERGRAEINNSGAGTFTGAFLYVTGSDFHYAQINGLEWQMNTPNGTLVKTDISAGGTSRIYLENISGNISNNRWKLEHNESGAGNIAWDFQNVDLQGHPITPTQVIDTATYPNIWVGGVTPILSRVYIKPYLI